MLFPVRVQLGSADRTIPSVWVQPHRHSSFRPFTFLNERKDAWVKTNGLVAFLMSRDGASIALATLDDLARGIDQITRLEPLSHDIFS